MCAGAHAPALSFGGLDERGAVRFREKMKNTLGRAGRHRSRPARFRHPPTPFGWGRGAVAVGCGL